MPSERVEVYLLLDGAYPIERPYAHDGPRHHATRLVRVRVRVRVRARVRVRVRVRGLGCVSCVVWHALGATAAWLEG